MLYFVTIVTWLYRGKAPFSIAVCGEASSLSACQNCSIDWAIQSLPPYRMHLQKSSNCVKTTVRSTGRAVWQSWRLSWGSLKLRAECTPGIQCSEHQKSFSEVNSQAICLPCMYCRSSSHLCRHCCCWQHSKSFTHMQEGRPHECVYLEYTHNKQNDSKLIYFPWLFDWIYHSRICDILEI